ncbi:MAG: zinc-dependent metalloprotease [Burkholderiaceae bacterium]|nr:zinc-dependent metalloprotease [Burkholderiaceae bacterium]
MSQSLLRLAPVAAAAMLLSACATVGGPVKPAAAAGDKTAAAAPAPASAASSAAKPPERPDPSAPKPFDEVIKGAQRDAGYIPVWRKDEKTWLEIAPERLGKPLILSLAIANAVGERGLYANQMVSDAQVELRIVGRVLQLRALNTAFRAKGDPAMARTVAESFSDSLLAAAPVLSASHKESKAVLVDASTLFIGDLPGLSTALEAAFRMPYGLDGKNSSIERARATEHSLALTTQLHFATPRIPAPPATPLPPTAPRPMPPSATPDPRSFFIGVAINLAGLPDKPMASRSADARVGNFAQSYTELGNDLTANPRVHLVNRWRLEKKDPAAALSEPVKPITFWLDRNIPQRYRAAVTAGILEWNKAFERIGFKNAVVALQQPDDAEFDTLDAEHASIRWFTGADVGFARGPSVVDPRTGEILDADIAMSDVFGRGARRFISEDVGFSSFAQRPVLQQLWGGAQADSAAYCTYAVDAAVERSFAFDLLEARGDLEPDSPEAEAFVQAQIKDTIMHEVGHTLGLKHNFRASTVITREQLKDKAFTDGNAISGSVMDYNAYNIPLAGEPKANFNVVTLGPYDYWAIEYAYAPFEAKDEAAGLAKILSRHTEPLLAFADDADAGGFGGLTGLDPRDNRFDLGDDPLAWTQKRLALSRELWQRLQARGPRAGDDPQRLRRSLVSGFRQLGRAPEIAAKYVGGMYTERDLPGPGARPAYRPVEPARQREALQFLTAGLFSVDSFQFKPEFLTSVGVDYVEWRRAAPVSVPQAVAAVQKQALDRLLSAGTAQRVLELPYYLSADQRKGAFSLQEVYTTLQSAVWSELKSGSEIDPLRRNLQREHLRRLQAMLTRGAPGLPADAQSLVRLNANDLLAQLRKAAGRGGLSVETRAHLQDSLGTLTEALRATMQRAV